MPSRTKNLGMITLALGDQISQGLAETFDSNKCERIKTYSSQTRKSRTFFRCKFQDCNKVFNKSSNFISHQRKHTGLKPFKCDICFGSYSQPGSLKRHKLTMHPTNSAD